VSDAAARRARLDALLDQALDLEGEARDRFVDALPPDDAGALRALLAAALATGDAIGIDAGLAQRLIGDAIGDVAAADTEPPFEVDAWLCTREIGAGGMGRVLLAERREAGFEQRGALKLIREEYASGEFARRFVQERRILARLDHPGIARLLDGGVDARARQYLVMEYVDGEPIDRWCDARAADLDTRIARFVEACEAVAFAHRHLVVHRDIKPSNIVVDADGRVRLLDFGIAKVLDTTAAPGDQTRAELRLFTPEYAAPEQVRGEAVGVATDVYQLGLLLYELLCGHRAQRVQGSGALAVERAVCLDDPPRPSQRVGPEDVDRARARSATPSTLRRRLRGDLDTLVMAALRKEPERRYPTVAALLDDVQRFRAGRPLRASDDGALRRGAKFARRHPFGVAASVVFVLLLVGYAATVTWQARALERERDRAQAEATKALQVQGLLQRLFEGIDPEASGGERLSVEELLDRGFAEIEQRTDLDAEVRAELLDTVGGVYDALGRHQRAVELLERATELAEELESRRPLLAARVYRNLGRALGRGNDVERASAFMQRSIELFSRHGTQPNLELARTLMQAGSVDLRRGQLELAERRFSEAIALSRAAAPSGQVDLASALARAVDLAVVRQRHADALPLLQEALAIQRRVLVPTHPAIAESLSSLASVQETLGSLDASAATFVQAIAAMRASRGERHPTVGITLLNQARLLQRLERWDEAERSLREAAEIVVDAYGDHHGTVARVLNDLAALLHRRSKTVEARALMGRALTAIPPSHERWRPGMLLSAASMELRLGDARRAESLLVEAERLLERSDAAPATKARARRLRANCDAALGSGAEALERAGQALALARSAGEAGAAEVAESILFLAETQLSLGDIAGAVDRLRDGHADVAEAPPDETRAQRLASLCARLPRACP
jgi:serine/threonine-protein kinase